MLHVKMARLVNFFTTSSLVISHHVLCETFDIDFIVNTHCQICSLIPVIVNVTSVYFLIWQMMQNLLSSLAYDIFVLRYGDLPLPRHMMFEQGSCYKNIAIWHLALCPGVFVHRNLSTKCSYVCAYYYAQLSYTIQHRTVLIVFSLYLQTVIIAQFCLSLERIYNKNYKCRKITLDTNHSKSMQNNN